MSRFLTVATRSRLRSLSIIAVHIGIIFRFIRQQNVLFITSGTVNDSDAIRVQTFDTGDSCFEARNNIFHFFDHRYLPGPFINVGMPKMGSTSLHNVSVLQSYVLLCK